MISAAIRVTGVVVTVASDPPDRRPHLPKLVVGSGICRAPVRFVTVSLSSHHLVSGGT